MPEPSKNPVELLEKRLRELESANLALRTREEQLNALISRSIIGIAEMDLSGRFILVNPFLCEIIGRPMNELLNTPLKDLIHPEDWKENEKFFIDIHKNGTSSVFELRYIRPDMSFVWTRNRVSLLTDSNGRPRSAAVLVEDISHERLTESERLLHQLIENLDQVIWMFDPMTPKALYVSESYERVWEQTREGLYEDPESYMVPVHPDDLEIVKQAYEKHKRGIPTDIEYRLRRRNGEIIWISDKSFPIRNERGQIYRLAGIAEDISARKNAEKALRESEEKYRKLIETTNEGIWIIDAKARTVYTNRHTAHLLGYEIEEMAERSIYEFLRETDYERAQTQMRLKPTGLKSQGEWLLKGKNDSDVWVMYCSNPMFDDNGQFSGALVMIMDITERKKSEELLREKLSDIERSYEELKTQMKERSLT